MAKIGFYLFLAPLYLISLLPTKILYMLSDFSAFVMRKVIGYRSDVIHVNIARSFPELKYAEIENIVKGFYKNFTDVFIELLWSITASDNKYLSVTEVENPAELKQFHDKGESVLIVLGHLANWEQIVSLNLSPSGYSYSDMRITYKKMQNKSSDLLLKWIRENHRVGKLLESNEIAKYMFKHKDESLCYFLVSDQSPLPGSKFAVDFLNQPTLMLNGPEQLSRKLNMPVAYLNISRLKRGRYKARLDLICEDPSKLEEGEITRRFSSLLEAGIRANPSDWLWSHKRWKRSIEELKKTNI